MIATTLITLTTNIVGLIVNSILLVELIGPWLNLTPPTFFKVIYDSIIPVSISKAGDWSAILAIIAFIYVAANVFLFSKSLLVDPQDYEERDGTEYTITKSCTGEYNVESKATYSGGGMAIIWNLIVFVVTWILLTCFGAILPLFLVLFKRFRKMTFGKFYGFDK